MKKFILLLFPIMLFLACSNDEFVEDNDNSNSSAIGGKRELFKFSYNGMTYESEYVIMPTGEYYFFNETVGKVHNELKTANAAVLIINKDLIFFDNEKQRDNYVENRPRLKTSHPYQVTLKVYQRAKYKGESALWIVEGSPSSTPVLEYVDLSLANFERRIASVRMNVKCWQPTPSMNLQTGGAKLTLYTEKYMGGYSDSFPSIVQSATATGTEYYTHDLNNQKITQAPSSNWNSKSRSLSITIY